MRTIDQGLGHFLLPGVTLSLMFVSWGHSQTVEWTRQFGSLDSDAGLSISADHRGNVYIGGQTFGSLNGPHGGGSDGYISKFDSTGTQEWTRQLSGPGHDHIYSVSVDNLGGVYFAGATYGRIVGLDSLNAQGILDSVVGKIDSVGNIQWFEQFGTRGIDLGLGISGDGLGNLYVSGYTNGNFDGQGSGIGSDAFLRKYDETGTHIWTKQLEAPFSFTRGSSVSADTLGNIFITGFTTGILGAENAGEQDAYVSKFDAAGVLQWSQQLGTLGDDEGFGVAADGLGNVYMTGSTEGGLEGQNAGSADAFLAKYDATGSLLWIDQFGTAEHDSGRSVSVDPLGNVYLARRTRGEVNGPNDGKADAFVRKYDPSGGLLWEQQIRLTAADLSFGVSADGLGNVYISGSTNVSPNSVAADVLVAKIRDVPEPASSTMLVVLGVILTKRASALRRN